MSNSTLSLYWDLAVTDPQLRNNACSKLIQSLTEFQQKFLAETQHTESELSSWESVKANCAPDICYALKRLIRGLSSSRDCAREGFTVALTELFRLMPNLTVGFATELIIDISKNNGTKSGQEEREVSFARLFGFEAIILSGMLNRKSTMSKDIVGLAQNLGTIMKKKEYLKEASTAVFINMLKHLQGQQESATLVIDQFLEECPQESLEIVWFYSDVSSIYPDYQHWKSKLSGWKKGNILHEKNKNTLKTVLIESTYYGDQIHSAFEAVVRRLVSLGHGLLDFWTLIEQSFFNGSHERKRIGFQVFAIVLNAAKLNEIPLIFTPNFMRCLINSLSSKETVLNKQAKQTTRSLADYAQVNQEAALPLVLQLLGEFGHFKFDAITNTNTVESILSNLTSEGIRQYCDHLIKIFYEPESLTSSNDGKRSSDAVQLWVIDQLYLFLRTGKIEKDKEWLEMIMNFVVVQGFFTVKSNSQSLPYIKPIKITDIIRQACKDKIGSSITYLKRVSLSDVYGNRLPLGEINGKTWAFHIVEKIEEFMKDSNFGFVGGLDKSILEASSRSKVLANKIHSQLSSTADNAGFLLELKAFESLFSHMSLFLYTGVEESGEVVQDIEHCYNVLVPVTESSSKKRKIEEDSLQPVDVLTDILISFLAKPSQVLRNLANEVFAAFAPKASSSILTIIFDVLNAKAGVEGADVLFDQDQGSGDDSSESTTEDDNDIDNESFDDENTAVDHELREKIEQALKTEHQDDLEDLNDEDMEIFDNKLAEIFGQRKALQKMKKGNLKFTRI